jgi:hypothetical protein
MSNAPPVPPPPPPPGAPLRAPPPASDYGGVGLADVVAELRALRHYVRERPPPPGVQDNASAGFDDQRQGVPDAYGSPASTGIRIPFQPGIRYRVLCAVVDLDAGDAVVGLRQAIELGAFAFGIGEPPPSSLYLHEVSSYNFRLPDGDTTWTLTEEPLVDRAQRQGPVDSDSFVFQDADEPAMVYDTAAFPMFPTAPGYLGLNAYTAPPLLGKKILSVRDLRWPWHKLANRAFRVPVIRPTRFRFYCDVLQSFGVTLVPPVHGMNIPPYVIEGLRPEDQFLLLFPGAVIYWRVAARILWQRDWRAAA